MRRIYLLRRLPSAFWCSISGHLSRISGLVLMNVSKFNVATFCGLANYQKLFHDGEVLRTFGNTLKYVVVTVPVGLFLSILIAALLNSKIKGTSIYRTLYFLPSVTMAAAVAMVWKWIYNEKMGILNSAIRALGGKGIGWLTDPKIALYSVMIVGLWMSVGYNMIILLAGMPGNFKILLRSSTD